MFLVSEEKFTFLSGYVVFRHPGEPERTQDIQVFQQGGAGVQPVPYAALLA